MRLLYLTGTNGKPVIIHPDNIRDIAEGFNEITIIGQVGKASMPVKESVDHIAQHLAKWNMLADIRGNFDE